MFRSDCSWIDSTLVPCSKKIYVQSASQRSIDKISGNLNEIHRGNSAPFTCLLSVTVVYIIPLVSCFLSFL